MQRLRDQRQRAGRSPAQGAGRRRAAQFGLGQLRKWVSARPRFVPSVSSR